MNNLDDSSHQDLPGSANLVGELPLTAMHLGIVLICSLALFFDALELSMSNVLGMVLGGSEAAGHGNRPHGTIGMIMGAAPLGGAIGAIHRTAATKITTIAPIAATAPARAAGGKPSSSWPRRRRTSR